VAGGLGASVIARSNYLAVTLDGVSRYHHTCRVNATTATRTAKPALGTCIKCGGSGHIRAFSHILGGECFACKGRGTVAVVIDSVESEIAAMSWDEYMSKYGPKARPAFAPAQPAFDPFAENDPFANG
jgi:hypothetical protein